MPANCTVHPSSGGGLVNGSSSLSGKTGPSPPNLAFLGMFLSVFASLCVTIGLALQKRVHKRLLEEGNSKRKYYQVPLWWAALILIMSDAFIDMATFGMAPQSLLAPLGAASLVWNTLLAPCLLGERLGKIELLGTLIIIVGATLAVAFSNHETPTYTMPDFHKLWRAPLMVCYEVFVILFMVTMYTIIKIKERHALKEATEDPNTAAAPGGNLKD